MFALNRFPTLLAEDDISIEHAQQGSQPKAADVLLAMQFCAEKKRVLYDSLQALSARIKVATSHWHGVPTIALLAAMECVVLGLCASGSVEVGLRSWGFRTCKAELF